MQTYLIFSEGVSSRRIQLLKATTNWLKNKFALLKMWIQLTNLGSRDKKFFYANREFFRLYIVLKISDKLEQVLVFVVHGWNIIEKA